MSRYPHTIENGSGERLTFLRRAAAPGGERLEVENRVQPGNGPPMHVHFHQEESITVVQGRLGYQRPGEEPRYVSAGDTVVFPPGEPHRFWNAGEEELRCTGYISPPDNVEYFLEALYESQRRAGSGRPDLFEAAFLSWRYRSEFAMVEISPLVRRLVFPVLVAVGTVLGRYARYADAPPPRRSPRSAV